MHLLVQTSALGSFNNNRTTINKPKSRKTGKTDSTLGLNVLCVGVNVRTLKLFHAIPIHLHHIPNILTNEYIVRQLIVFQ